MLFSRDISWDCLVVIEWDLMFKSPVGLMIRSGIRETSHHITGIRVIPERGIFTDQPV